MKRFGIVGAGIIGASHKEALLEDPDCLIAAVCDVVIEKAKLLASGTNASVYTDYRQMCEEVALDAVILNLPHFLHNEVSIYFLQHHIPVLVEKPMANTVVECDEMIAAAEENQTILAVGHVQRYYGCYQKIREWTSDGSLGKLCQIVEIRNIDYFTDRPKWFLNKKQAGGGILMNYGAHTLDKILYTTDLQVEQVTAAGNNFLTEDDVEATAQMLIQLSGNVSAVATYCGTHMPELQYETYFYFTDGVAKVLHGYELFVSAHGKPFERVDLDNETNLFESQLIEFLRLLDGQPSQIATGTYGRKVIQTLETAFRQIESNTDAE